MNDAAQPASTETGVTSSTNAEPVPKTSIAAKPRSTAHLFFAALGNPLRWEMVKMLADGRAMSATEVARVLKRDFDGISKHLRVLRSAGVVRSRPGDDQRVVVFEIPEANRPEPGVLVYGFIRLTLSDHSQSPP